MKAGDKIFRVDRMAVSLTIGCAIAHKVTPKYVYLHGSGQAFLWAHRIAAGEADATPRAAVQRFLQEEREELALLERGAARCRAGILEAEKYLQTGEGAGIELAEPVSRAKETP